MKDEILKIIYDYSINGKLIDNKFIEKLIDIVINAKDLNSYFSTLEFINSDNSEHNSTLKKITVAGYNPITKSIIIYLNGLEKYLERYSQLEYLFTSDEKLFYKNILITQIILHELEHVYQSKILDSGENLEYQILRLSNRHEILFKDDNKLIKELQKMGVTSEEIKLYIMEKCKKYKNNYRYDPGERLAEIKSNTQLFNIINPINNTIPNIILFQKIRVLQNMIRGYEYTNGILESPTINYMLACGYKISLDKFNWYDENHDNCIKKCSSLYNFFERTLYGLPIYKEEYNNVVKNMKRKSGMLY